MLTKEERELYRSMGNTPNERGLKWKEYRMNHLDEGLIREMQNYYDECFLRYVKLYEQRIIGGTL